jgi:hypothetical protein
MGTEIAPWRASHFSRVPDKSCFGDLGISGGEAQFLAPRMLASHGKRVQSLRAHIVEGCEKRRRKGA